MDVTTFASTHLVKEELTLPYCIWESNKECVVVNRECVVVNRVEGRRCKGQIADTCRIFSPFLLHLPEELANTILFLDLL